MEEIKIGSHVGMAGKEMFLASVKEAERYGANVLMLYTGAPQNTRRKEIKDLNIEAGWEYATKAGIREIVVHAPYIINLANTVKLETFELAVEFLEKEIRRTAAMRSKILVLHPGSALDAGAEAGIAQTVRGLNMVLDANGDDVFIALETMAGKGSEIGRTFEEIRAIYDGVHKKERLRVCFDTCHVNDAGYDLVHDYEGVFETFDKVIGPRSALFTPFPHLGLIIIDEEHETSYKSETAPRYHARDVAIERARMNDASVLLGSATPSVDSYYQAMQGKYQLLTLSERVEKKPLPDCEVVDLRSELRAGNRSIFSERLQELMEDRLKKRQQIMLFLNRRGISGFISCRACGYVIQCPHCDVSLSQHAGGRMVCHYCGYEQPLPKICPSCGSKYLGGFKAGTQKIEMLVQQRFPQARVMRMDFDTTRTKDAYEKILHAFANQEADILIGTQMIVKGHDFPNVTLVGVLAADMSLHVPDFHASERTFQLLTQAVGRAGRGKEPGQAVIQTYDPDHFAIQTAKEQDYDAFYKQEIAYRRMLAYPPVWQLLLIHCTGTDPQVTTAAARDLAEFLHRVISQKGKNIMLVGPADASIAKISDVYRKVIYMKAPEYATLVACKDLVERKIKNNSTFSNVSVQFDFNPTSGF